jgi:hypothetical protein
VTASQPFRLIDAGECDCRGIADQQCGVQLLSAYRGRVGSPSAMDRGTLAIDE